jgi:RNA polymerase subunit RPABC4/transcription elongation factor Spt4
VYLQYFIDSYIIGNNVLTLVLQAIVVYFAFLWISLIVWVTRDVIQRSNSILFQIFAILLNTLLPILGLLMYLLLRSPRTLLEKYYDEMELKMISSQKKCEKCLQEIESSYIFCPHCSNVLQEVCASCKKYFPKNYDICPFCSKKRKKSS